MPPRQSYTHEHQLQADCVIQFSHHYPELRGQLWANFTEQAAQNAGKKRSLGLVAGLPDLMFRHEKMFVGIELKLPGKVHKVDHLKKQAEWMAKNCDIGVFVDSLDGFFEIINRVVNMRTFLVLNKSVHAQHVMEFLATLGTQKSFTWDLERLKTY